MFLPVGKPVKEFRSFFHDGKVCRKVCIEDVINADLLEGTYEFAKGGVLYA